MDPERFVRFRRANRMKGCTAEVMTCDDMWAGMSEEARAGNCPQVKFPNSTSDPYRSERNPTVVAYLSRSRHYAKAFKASSHLNLTAPI